jgi:hypothetical protein
MDPKYNHDKPKTNQETREHNKSGGGHKEQTGQREGTQQEQKKRSGMSRE